MVEEESVAEHVDERGQRCAGFRAWPGHGRSEASDHSDDEPCGQGNDALMDLGHDAAAKEILQVAQFYAAVGDHSGAPSARCRGIVRFATS